jgi:hypothetical protein
MSNIYILIGLIILLAIMFIVIFRLIEYTYFPGLEDERYFEFLHKYSNRYYDIRILDLTIFIHGYAQTYLYYLIYDKKSYRLYYVKNDNLSGYERFELKNSYLNIDVIIKTQCKLLTKGSNVFVNKKELAKLLAGINPNLP